MENYYPDGRIEFPSCWRKSTSHNPIECNTKKWLYVVDLLPKKEVIKLKAERDKLEENLGGIKEMRTLPGVMFIVDPDQEDIAVMEARKLHIPIVAITDTNCDPDLIDHVIPGNDDAIRGIKLILSVMADAVLEGKQGEQFTDSASDKEEAKDAE